MRSMTKRGRKTGEGQREGERERKRERQVNHDSFNNDRDFLLVPLQ
jgi:hypothetical protein